MRNRLQLTLQVMLVLISVLLGIATNYATNEADAPLVFRIIQQAAAPAIGVLIIGMIIGQIVVYRLENPARPEADWPRDRVPYPGLDAFAEDEAAVFFGREPQIREVCRRLLASTDRPSDRFTAIVGASGSGKSSLVRAGVIPRLRGRRWTVLPPMTPGSNPMHSLAAALAAGQGDESQTSMVLRRLRQGPHTASSEFSRLPGGSFRRTLLLIDQFEEILTLAGEREREQFLKTLSACLSRVPSLRVLATLRVEFLGQLLNTDHAELVEQPVVIGALGRNQLSEVVRRPGELVGLSFAPGLIADIVDDVGSDDALPLLAYLLQELYFAADPGNVVTEEMYRGLGGVAGALARQADHTVADIGAGEGVAVVLRVLLKFVTVQGQEVARRRVPMSELTADERRIVDAFVEARLLVSGAAGDVHTGQDPYAQVAHEALFRQWAPLRQEVEARVEQLRQRGELERWAEDWEQSGRSDDYLLTGERLSLAQRWLAALEDAGQASERARRLVHTSQRHDLDFLRRISDSIGQYVLGSAEEHPERAILLSLAALGECVPTSAARQGLLTALAFSHLRTRLDGHTDTVRDIAWSPDGQRIATASRDGTARIFDAHSGRSLLVLSAEGTMIESVTWSSDSSRIATAGREHVVRIWDAVSGEPLRLLLGATDISRQTAWSPDGRHIAATSKDQVVRVWEADTGELTHALRGHVGDVWGVAWSPDGSRLVSASHDQTAVVWDLASGSPTRTLSGHSDFVEGVAWSPDGSAIATGSGDRTVRIWDADNGQQRLLLRGHADYVWNIAWSPDGSMLASASSDRTVRVVRTTDAEVLAVLRGHSDTVWGVTWSPSGDQIGSGSTDGSGCVWDLKPSGAESVLIDARGGQVHQAAWHPTEKRLATACEAGTVRVWDVATRAQAGETIQLADRVWSVAWSPDGDRLALSTNDGLFRVMHVANTMSIQFEHHSEVIESCDWSPDGGRIATGGHDGSVRVWDVRTGSALAVLTGHQDWVGRVTWAPSGRLLASTSDDRTCRLWDVAESRQMTVLRGHENYVDDVAWSPDEQRLATASGDWTAAVWETSTGRFLGALKGHEGRVRAVAWSPAATHIATGSDDGTIRIWSATTFEELRIVGVHQHKVTSVAWSADGTRLLTASFDGTVRIWPAEPAFDQLEAEARGRVFRTLTPEERQRHLLPTAPG